MPRELGLTGTGRGPGTATPGLLRRLRGSSQEKILAGVFS